MDIVLLTDHKYHIDIALIRTTSGQSAAGHVSAEDLAPQSPLGWSLISCRITDTVSATLSGKSMTYMVSPISH